jgi:HD-GYP domain-containing protein (c-di-GMP phosphodiesterase class II)
MHQRTAQVVIVMDNCPFVDDIKKQITDIDGEIFHFTSAEEALDIMSDPISIVHALFIDPDFVPKNWTTIIREGHLNHCSIPIFLTNQNVTQILSEVEINNLGVRKIIDQSEEAKTIIKNITYHLRQFNDTDELTAKMLKEEAEINHSDLVAISAENFLSGNESFFDVYIKIRSDKFIKILTAGDTFSPERLNCYLEKGLQFLYINKSSQQKYLEFCDLITKRILESEHIDTDIKVAQVLNQGQEVVSFLRESGLDEKTLLFAQNYAANTLTMVSQLKTDSKSIGKVLGAITNFDHTAGTAIVCGLLAREYGMHGNDLSEVMALSATLHDIGLSKMEDLFTHDPNHKLFDEDLIEREIASDSCSSMRKIELTVAFEKHHEWGADMIQMIDNIPPLIAQNVFQHHMRLDGTGFPKLESNQQITPHAQILGLADEYVKLISQITRGNKSKDDLANFPQKFCGFTSNITEVFSRLFFK